MEREKSLPNMVDEDIAYCQEVWKKYSHDRDQMEVLFYKLLYTYIDKIENLSEGLGVVSPYDKSSGMADTYRQNVRKLIHRLELFRENHYSNQGLWERYLEAENEKVDNGGVAMDFNQARLFIMEREELPEGQKNEIIDHIDEIEEICNRIEPKKNKWDRLRPHLIWLSGKDVSVALQILPLFMRMK